MINIKVSSFIGFIFSNIICYYVFLNMFNIYQNIESNNTIFLNLFLFLYFIIFSFIFIIFEILTIISLYFINNNIYFNQEKYAKYN
jgi:hypothetical protein